MLTIYVVRHGKTEGNRRGVIMGHTDTPLIKSGEKVVLGVAKKLKTVTFNKVYSSDLGRAFITAYIISKKLGIESKLEKTKELREIDCGLYTNKTAKEAVEKYRDRIKSKHFVWPGGEGYIQFQKKIIDFIKKLEKKYNNKTVLIVGHSGTIKAIESFFNSSKYKNCFKEKIPHNYIGKFVVDKGKLVSYERIEKGR